MDINQLRRLFRQYATMSAKEQSDLVIEFPAGAPRSYAEARKCGAVTAVHNNSVEVKVNGDEGGVTMIAYYDDDRKISAGTSDDIQVDFYANKTLVTDYSTASWDYITAKPVPGLIVKNG